MYSNSIRLALAIAMTVYLAARTSAQSILIDDFNDGNDDGWIHVDLSQGQPGGPAIYDASSGAYNIRTTDVVPGDTFAAALSLWGGSFDPTFSNGFLRATVRADNAGTANDLLMRWSTSGPPGGYTFGLENRASGLDDFFFVVVGDNQVMRLESFSVPGFPVSEGEDWIIEAGAIGDQISMKVWPAREPEPAAPQLSLTDTTYTSGPLGLAVPKDPTVLPEAWQLNGTFDDVSFRPVPEPSTWLLAIVAAGFGLLRISCK